eukprot:scaffold149_cov315-Pinguiococcus_pyrenoidosus.AAC.142
MTSPSSPVQKSSLSPPHTTHKAAEIRSGRCKCSSNHPALAEYPKTIPGPVLGAIILGGSAVGDFADAFGQVTVTDGWDGNAERCNNAVNAFITPDSC